MELDVRYLKALKLLKARTELALDLLCSRPTIGREDREELKKSFDKRQADLQNECQHIAQAIMNLNRRNYFKNSISVLDVDELLLCRLLDVSRTELVSSGTSKASQAG